MTRRRRELRRIGTKKYKKKEEKKVEVIDDWKYRKKIKVSRKIDLQFDYRNSIMISMRDISEKVYWFLCWLFVIQFLLLVYRGVGLFPLYALIEYL